MVQERAAWSSSLPGDQSPSGPPFRRTRQAEAIQVGTPNRGRTTALKISHKARKRTGINHSILSSFPEIPPYSERISVYFIPCCLPSPNLHPTRKASLLTSIKPLPLRDPRGSEPDPHHGFHVERVPQPPDSSERFKPPKPTREKSLRTFLEPHFPQAGVSFSASSGRRKKTSKRCPHSWQRYSNMGISYLLSTSFKREYTPPLLRRP